MSYSAFDGSNPTAAKRMRVFTQSNYREVVTGALLDQLVRDGLVPAVPDVNYCLVAGHIVEKDRSAIEGHFEAQRWCLRDECWVVDGLRDLANGAYEDDVVTMAAKLLGRAAP